MENEEIIPFYKPPEDKLNFTMDAIEELKDAANPFLEFVEKAGKEGPKKPEDFWLLWI